MAGEIGQMLGRETCEHSGRVGLQQRLLSHTKRRMKHRFARVVEADLARVERGVPQSREQQAMVDVEAVRVVIALGPRHDMRGAKQGCIADCV